MESRAAAEIFVASLNREQKEALSEALRVDKDRYYYYLSWASGQALLRKTRGTNEVMLVVIASRQSETGSYRLDDSFDVWDLQQVIDRYRREALGHD